MKLLTLAFLCLRHSGRRSLLFVLQLAAVFAVINLLLAGLNNQSMRSVPYETFFERGGHFCWTYQGMDIENADKYEPDAILEQLEGDLTAMVMYRGNVQWEYKEIACVVFEDTILKEMRLPLAAGQQLNTEQAALISPNAWGISAGDVLKTDSGQTIPIAGELTNPTYEPTWSQWEQNGDVSMFYEKWDLQSADMPFLLMSVSTARACGLQNRLSPQAGILFTYNTPPTEETYRANADTLETLGLLTNSTDMKARTEASLKAAYQKFVPLGLLVFLVALVGFVFHIALQTLSRTRTYVVYYLCGMDWKKIAALNAMMLLILLSSALLLCGGFVWVSVRTVISAQFGLLYQTNHLLVTIAMCMLCFLAALLVPCLMIHHQSPADLLRRKTL